MMAVASISRLHAEGAARGESFGLLGIQERVELLGGES